MKALCGLIQKPDKYNKVYFRMNVKYSLKFQLILVTLLTLATSCLPPCFGFPAPITCKISVWSPWWVCWWWRMSLKHSLYTISFLKSLAGDTKTMIHLSWQVRACFGKSKAAMFNYRRKLSRQNQWVLYLLGSQNRNLAPRHGGSTLLWISLWYMIARLFGSHYVVGELMLETNLRVPSWSLMPIYTAGHCWWFSNSGDSELACI